MGIVIRSVAGKSVAKPPALALKKAAPPISVVLPSVVSEPATDINEYYALICGEPGIGKTTLGMQEPGVLLLTCDPFQKSLRALQLYIPDWKTFEATLTALEEAVKKGPFPYKRVLLDGADLWYKHCHNWACKKLMIDHPADEAWGKGWDLITSTFIRAVDRLMALPCGVWFICHSRVKERETRDGLKADVLAPTLSTKAEDTLVGKCDLVVNMHYVGDDRVGVIRGSQSVVAKCRIDGRFQTPDGRHVHEINFGNDGPKVAYDRLLEAFENQQTYASYAETKPTATVASSGKKGVIVIRKGVK